MKMMKHKIKELTEKVMKEKWDKHSAPEAKPTYDPEYVADLINRGREILRQRKNK